MSMRPLFPEDLQRMAAARQHIETGSPAKALAELNSMTPRMRFHPLALKLRAQAFAKANKWETVADICADLDPNVEDTEVDLLHGEALHQMGETLDVYVGMEQSAELFKDSAQWNYAMARYACRLGYLDEAEKWLKAALELGGDELKLKALHDPDLERMHG